MDIAISTAQRLRNTDKCFSTAALVNRLLTEYNIIVDIWPVQTDKFAGCLWKNDEEWTIVLNAKQNPRRRLFTIAHELGHYFLHRHLKTQFTCNPDTAYPGSRLEREANRFAAELLMPLEAICHGVRHQYSLPRIANTLGVSETAVVYRLQDLQITK
jgi:Zn-dependent peptidase ImmA (M78 family)